MQVKHALELDLEIYDALNVFIGFVSELICSILRQTLIKALLLERQPQSGLREFA